MKKSQSWRELNNVLSLKTEQEVLELLNEEKAGAKRISILERLHQRYNTLRVSRERMEILAEAKAK